MSGQMISFKGNGKPYQGYLSPSSAGQGPGVIVIQEYWGLVGHIKDVADRIAQEGFTALAPDFYHGKSTEEPDEAGRLMMALDIADAEKVIHGAIDALLANPATNGDKVGVVGFCMGGQLALFAACINPKVGAVVDFYGIHPHVDPNYQSLRAPFLGFFAEHDTYVPPEAVKSLSDKLKKYGKEHKCVSYEGTDHAFFNDRRPEVYNKKAAEDTWRQMISHFRNNL